MLTGDIRGRIDQIWNAFWAGGIANPLEVIEQITYLLFIRRLDDLQTLEENKANRLQQPVARRIFPEGKDAKGRRYADYRWSRFKHLAPAEMFDVIGEHVFPYLRTGLAQQLGNGESTYAHHMKDARFTIPTPALLAKVVDLLDKVPMEERDTKGDRDSCVGLHKHIVMQDTRRGCEVNCPVKPVPAFAAEPLDHLVGRCNR